MGIFNQATPMNSAETPGIMPQLIFSLTLLAILYVVLLFIEVVYKYFNRLSINRKVLLPNTYNIDDKSITIPQNPNITGNNHVSPSDNERSGIEFSYTFYLNVNPSAFRQEYGLCHIFHKGYSSQFPLLAPGVYMRSDTNTLRVYMNSYKTWNNFIEVENIPIGKWVHIALVVSENSLEIYINGNLAKKMSFEGFAPYQNYQDIQCFSQRRITMKKSMIPSIDENGFDVFGAMKGQISRLNYFSYALCYAEIQKLMNEGPSSKLDSALATGNVPPYLNDTWWNQGY
ncbi:MAG: LamG-like jellyroll fold domain-containing protein [Actinomycetes bacterium]